MSLNVMCVCACEQNQLKDRSEIQLYSKAAGVYLGLRVSGQVVAMTNPDNDASECMSLFRKLFPFTNPICACRQTDVYC